MKNKRALIISPTYAPALGGAETQARLLAEQLVGRGYEVFVVTGRFDAELLRYELQAGVQIQRFDNWYELINLIVSKRRVELVLWNGIPYKYNFMQIAFRVLLLGLCRLISGQIIWRVPSLSVGFLNSLKFISPFIDKWLVLSDEQKDALTSYGIKAARLIEPPNTITEISVRSRDLTKKSSREDKVKIIYCSRLIKSKGLGTFVDAINLLPKQIRNKLEIFLLLSLSWDKPNESRECLKQINSLDCKSRIVFEEPDVRKYFQQADVGVFPSLSEGSPNVLREMMAAGLAVVSSDIPSCQEIITDGRDGQLFRAGNVSDLRTKLELLLTDVELRGALQRNAPLKIKSIGNPDMIMSKILQEGQQTINGRYALFDL